MEDGLSRRVFLEILAIGALTFKDGTNPGTLNRPELPKRQDYIFSYEEWKTARKNPVSMEAALVKDKATKIRKNPDISLRLLSPLMRKSHDEDIDITRKELVHLSNMRTQKGFEGITGIILYGKYMEYRTELFNLYPGVIDFDNPGKGEEIILSLHKMYERRYNKERKRK
ncbi:hypothetical protein GOV12_08195 [Candidatus Pacearchaeota archaeon]|nr:hypothetical protein [Candidatus Pacearchaeota archaeon]